MITSSFVTGRLTMSLFLPTWSTGPGPWTSSLRGRHLLEGRRPQP
ncbi:hypothetical protein [Streptomyces viridochromogenes]|nr:hypothetical protein [Streptomyces viridochromogenes]